MNKLMYRSIIYLDGKQFEVVSVEQINSILHGKHDMSVRFPEDVKCIISRKALVPVILVYCKRKISRD